MSNKRYKVFFTIHFSYAIGKKKTITKFFKSDLNLSSYDFKDQINDSNIYYLWKKYVKKKELSDLSSPENYIETNVSERKLITHRIVNLSNLTEVFLT